MNYDYQIKIKKSMIKIPQVFFWKFYSRGKLTCTKTFCFVISTKECICNTQFHGLVAPTVHSSMLSLKNPKLREQLFSGKKAVPLMKVLLTLKIGREKWRIWKISRGKVTNFSEVTKFFRDESFPRFFFPDKVQSGPITKYRVLPVTSLFFSKTLF